VLVVDKEQELFSLRGFCEAKARGTGNFAGPWTRAVASIPRDHLVLSGLLKVSCLSDSGGDVGR
jgi:hypothetical protein